MQLFLKRLNDIFVSLLGLIFFLPFGIIISILIVTGSRGGVFFIQKRVGKSNKDFGMFKFRTMRKDSEKKGLLITVGNDIRITSTGKFLRKFKLDEIPQLINVLIGDMSLVGPRPEVRKYVDMYTEEQKKVLLVKPGLTDYASIEYINENDILGRSPDPEKTYIEEVMPAKLKLNEKYLDNVTISHDFRIMWKTLVKIIVQ